MKSERRHELEKNELADWMVGVGQKVKPYQNAILIAALLMIGAGVIFAWSFKRSADRNEAGWTAFFQALDARTPDPVEFEELAKNEAYKGTEMANWALVIAADRHLAAGCRDLFINKADAKDHLRSAVEQYTKVLEQTGQSSLMNRATFGLARALESQGELDAAVKQYEKVVDEWPNGAYTKMAEQQIRLLNTKSMRYNYAQLAEYDPKFDLQAAPGPTETFGPSGDPLAPGGPTPPPGEPPLFEPMIDDGFTPGDVTPPPTTPPSTTTPPTTPPSTTPPTTTPPATTPPDFPGPTLPGPTLPGPTLPEFPAPETPGPALPAPEKPTGG